MDLFFYLEVKHSQKTLKPPLCLLIPAAMRDTTTDINVFDKILRRRLRDQDVIEKHQVSASGEDTTSKKKDDKDMGRHFPGQSGCFCTECLVHRKQEWRIGDVNVEFTGPRDRWQQYGWGNSERGALYKSERELAKPEVTPIISEKVKLYRRRGTEITFEREAKFIDVASGKYHTLMLSESSKVFACGDNTHGALGIESIEKESSLPHHVEGLVDGKVTVIAATEYSSFALVVPTNTIVSTTPSESSSNAPRSVQGRRLSVKSKLLQRYKMEERDKRVHNLLYVWGLGDRGVLGLGHNECSPSPRVLSFFSNKRVLQLSAGRQHALILTEHDGLFAFGDNRYSQLGVGSVEYCSEPTKVQGLDILHVIHITAGNDHSIAVIGATFFDRQVYSWGCGSNGRLGHNSETTMARPIRIDFFRGRKVLTVSAGGAHNLALSEMDKGGGVCVWSWGSNKHGQLGHRDNWDCLLPRSVTEIRKEKIEYIFAGEHHSIALSERKEVWAWGKSVHANDNIPHADFSTTTVLLPVKVELDDLHLVGVKAGRGRTFVWGDRAPKKENQRRKIGGAPAFEMCLALPQHESLKSDSLRILYRCGSCGMNTVCIACAYRCHASHCLELSYTLEDTLSRECNCADGQHCMFQAELPANIEEDHPCSETA